MSVVSSFRSVLVGTGLALAITSCQSDSSTSTRTATSTAPATAPEIDNAHALQPGQWRGVLMAQQQEIPFLFDIRNAGGKPLMILKNGEERLQLDEIETVGDSIIIRLGIFDAALVVRPYGLDQIRGTWVKYDAKTPYRVPFKATRGDAQKLFPVSAQAKPYTFDGTWDVTFKDEEGKTYPAVGAFKQTGSDITGTFLTTTGDYRYLAGQVDGNTLRVATFDGSHGFLFTGNMLSDLKKADTTTTMNGDFYSGKNGHETWEARRNPNAKLPDANSLTYMKPGQKKLAFKFPNIYEGGSISPADPKYRGKVVVVQLLGSWCPNCMDETAFLAPWYEQNKSRGVEIIGLGYERSADYAKASERLRKMKERLSVGYDIAVAGVANKDSAAKSLPQIAKVLAFPTTIILGKKGEVRKIHTGFSGPGTGKYYDEYVADFNRTIDKLLKE